MLERIARGEVRVAVVGLGYVGLPLAVAFGGRYDTLGFDVQAERVAALRAGRDDTGETAPEELAAAPRLRYTDDPAELAGRDVYVVAVPTPVDASQRPDLRPLLAATRSVAGRMAKGAVVVYESTVYPGCTEECCVPLLEAESGLKYNRDFFCGYSPERVNPGDREHRLARIVKITSGSTPEAADIVDRLYNGILENGTHRAPSIKVAEAAKVIENAQRDLNIAFVNELAKIFRLIGVDTRDVLAAAATKWNFLPFHPGLVGGHCIGVDPYYLTHKAQALGYHPEVILAGRRLNDGMGRYVAEEVVKLLARKTGKIVGARVLQLGITFKENCPDIRNSRAVDVARGLAEFGCRVEVVDPRADAAEVEREYGFVSRRTVDPAAFGHYDAVVLTVAHREFTALDVPALGHANTVVYDVKAALPREWVDGRL